MRRSSGAIICALAQSVVSLCTLLPASCVFERRSQGESLSIMAISHPPSCSSQASRLIRASPNVDKVAASPLQLDLSDSQGACTYNPNDLAVVFLLTI